MHSRFVNIRVLLIRVAVVLIVLLQSLQGFALADDPEAGGTLSAATNKGRIEFKTDIAPLLRQHCMRCHGPTKQEAGFRLDQQKSAFSTGDSGEALIVPGAADESLLVLRVSDADHGDLMPLDSSALDQKSIDLLSRWIDEGAQWDVKSDEAEHWAYRPLKRPTMPGLIEVQESGCGPENAVDRFLQARMDDLQLQPSAKAGRRRIIRRLSLALIGVPPTPEEVQAFLNDPSPNAYEKVVDRLLQSPRFGEFWAIPWLDLARYADSNGFQADQLRDNWAYRDWVIRALNSDLPFDQFVIDQLAGDLIEDATIDQHIATGFHRMTTCNVEAGVDPEANRVNQIVDRVNTTATIFMGTTLECAQCHDHKYDPFTQRDYYRLFAYFNNTPLEVENTSGVTWDFYGPMMELPLPEELAEKRTRLERELEKAKADRESISSSLDKQFDEWLASLKKSDPDAIDWKTVSPSSFSSDGGEEYSIQENGAVLLAGKVPDKATYTATFCGPLTQDPLTQDPVTKITAIRLEALTDDALPGTGPGRGDEQRTNFIVSEFKAEVLAKGAPRELAFTTAVADFSQSGWDVSNAIDADRKTGWAIAPKFGESHWAAFVLEEPVELSAEDELRIQVEQFYGRGRVIGKIRFSFLADDSQSLRVDPTILELVRKEKPGEQDLTKLRASFDSEQPSLSELDSRIQQLESQLNALAPPTTLVMEEIDKPRETFVMLRGNYESLGDQVQAGIPTVFGEDVQAAAANDASAGDRLELARWLTSSGNPLLPRVTVNRWWASIFGRGLVGTPEDFGSQAEPPTHPDLLDWLACELVETGWSRKHVLKTMVMSHAFRQEAASDQPSLAKDPHNDWLARGPRMRLSAEAIRDHGLAVSGLLTTRMYGPPVMPFQPEKIWRSVGRNQPTWNAAENEDRFRRGVYVICKRAAPYPSFINFDAPNRSSCTVQRSSTNTPLQALTLLNDPAYAEMCLALAERILLESAGCEQEDRIKFAFELVLSRPPGSFEIATISQLLANEERDLTEDEVRARTEPPVPSMKLRVKERRELAAWFAVANVLLNLDEAMSR